MDTTTQIVNFRQKVSEGRSWADTWGKNTTVQVEGISSANREQKWV